MAKKLKIFFHDNCFDGCASAAVFADFYRAVIDPDADVVFQGVQHKQGDPFEDYAIDGDDNACLDFRYSTSENMTWWFDHHVSAFQPPEFREHFEADTGGQKFYDPTAPSNTKFEHDTLRDKFGYEPPESFADLIYWAEIIDGARFTDAAMAVKLAEPALQLMTWIENNPDPELTHRFIGLLGHKSFAEIVAEPWVSGPLELLLQRHQRNIELIREHATCEGGVVFFDLIDEDVFAYNKFISYFLFPDARYTVGLTSSDTRVKLSVGCNPWGKVPREHNIATICERYGGGGHPVVGAISLEPDQIARAREIGAEVRAELST